MWQVLTPKPLPWLPTLNPAHFHWSFSLYPHPYVFSRDPFRARLWPRLGQINCMWLISCGCYYQEKWKLFLVCSCLQNTGLCVASSSKTRQHLCFLSLAQTLNSPDSSTSAAPARNSNWKLTSPPWWLPLCMQLQRQYKYLSCLQFQSWCFHVSMRTVLFNHHWKKMNNQTNEAHKT